MSQRIVIIGGGHAAAQLCQGLASAGLGPHTTLVCAEAEPPYQRPPLSKRFLQDPQATVQTLLSVEQLGTQGFTIHQGKTATAIDTASKTVQLASGAKLSWDWLVLATGARARTIATLAHLDNVTTLRQAHDAIRLRDRLPAARHVTVIGGGFIGLEIAATAASLGKSVTVIEAAPRLLARAISPDLSARIAAHHRQAGVDIRLQACVADYRIDGGRVTHLVLGDELLPTDLVIVGIGAIPETALAEQAGIACDDGVLVDPLMQTSAPGVLATGDCARLCAGPGLPSVRLESVQNANDQARAAVATLRGEPKPYDAVPWFWSDQGTLRLQMAGLLPPDVTSSVVRQGQDVASCSLFHYRGDILACVESVNAPGDHLAARRMLQSGIHPAPAQVGDATVPLVNLLRAA
ncbi:MAG TPA: FAD-dependent oxidoreductase [Burkholderiaceae bacterium]|nr:FAD-dependent oxidoreductase [Burkholderiaceae bacterium]